MLCLKCRSGLNGLSTYQLVVLFVHVLLGCILLIIKSIALLDVGSIGAELIWVQLRLRRDVLRYMSCLLKNRCKIELPDGADCIIMHIRYETLRRDHLLKGVVGAPRNLLMMVGSLESLHILGLISCCCLLWVSLRHYLALLWSRNPVLLLAFWTSLLDEYLSS